MYPAVLLAMTDHLPLAVAAIAIGIGAKALASVLHTWIEESSRTNRLTRALENSQPSQRPGIIAACSQLERKSADDLTRDDSTVAAQIVPSAALTQAGRGRQRNRDR
jgi:hypothetical protein